MTARSIRGALCLAAAGLTVAAAPALATEGPPPGGPGGGGGGGGGGQPLPNTLAPVTIPQQLGPSVQRQPATKRAKRPRITRINMTRRVRAHHHAHLRVRLATTGRVQIVIQRNGKKAKRVWTRTVNARRTSVTVHLPEGLKAGRYRVTVVSVDAQGQSSRPVSRSLQVVGH
jgi:hypothetical protein